MLLISYFLNKIKSHISYLCDIDFEKLNNNNPKPLYFTNQIIENRANQIMLVKNVYYYCYQCFNLFFQFFLYYFNKNLFSRFTLKNNQIHRKISLELYNLKINVT